MSSISALPSYNPYYVSSYQNQKDATFDNLLTGFSNQDTSTAKKMSNITGGILNVDLAAFGTSNENDNQKDPLLGLIDELFAKMKATVDRVNNTSTESLTKPVFSFSSEFQSIFGTSGPLFDFINVVTARLGLSGEKNMALQNIAINHKDTTGSKEDVEKIAKELNEAGIGTFMPA